MMTEAQLMEQVANLFADRGWPIAQEFPYFGRRIDLVAVDPQTGDVTLVEGKLKNWQKGVSQILLARSCAHSSFLAIAAVFASRVSREVLINFSIGLISVDGEAHIEIEAPPVPCTNCYCAAMVREALSSPGGGHSGVEDC